MEHLSSCYFCGAALDERLQQYPVVPESLREDEDVPTATLCPACHQKLETVFDAVVESGTASLSATKEPRDDTLAAPADTSAAVSDTPNEGTEVPATDDSQSTDKPIDEEPTVESGDEMWESAADDVASTSEADAGGDEHSDEEDDLFDRDEPITAEPGDSSGADDTAESAGDDETVTADDIAALAGDIDGDTFDNEEETDETDEELQSAMEPDVPTEFQGTDESTDTEPTEQEPAESESVEHEPSEEAAPSGADGSEALESTEGGSETTTDSEPSPDSETVRTSISALEYNKVMRLLQNRSFPVARDEIETVAANAYGLSQAECAEVIDLAVDRGLIDEDGDQLVRSE